MVHYMPLEYYPPVTNLLDCLSQEKDLQIKTWSCFNVKNRKEYTSGDQIKISRTTFPKSSDTKLQRFLKYVRFNLNCFWGLVLFQPDKILYFESYSVGPVYYFLKLFGSKTELLIHNHEYFDPEWYKSGMTLVKHYHEQEKSYLFEKASWISQTNKDRVRLFIQDHGEELTKKMRVLPNYPPKSWTIHPKSKDHDGAIKTVFIGSLSLKTTYLENYCNWVIDQNGKVLMDIFSYNLDLDTKDYLNNLSSPYIKFDGGGVEYHDIPKKLSKYDVGLILYKAYSPNFKYNAPNKLFEYLTCNLQVWYAEELMGIAPYQSNRVVPIDFQNINDFRPDALLNAASVGVSSRFSAEEALMPLIDKLKQ